MKDLDAAGLDCLAALPILREEPGLGFPLTKPLHLIDVGSGAGFPGAPLKLAAPKLKATLLDGTGKKVEFLKHLARVLELQNTSVVQGRAEEIGREQAFRGQFDLVAARAVAPMATLVELIVEDVGSPVVDRTGFTEPFIASLEFAVGPPPGFNSSLPAVSAALQQLGLQLNPKRDHMEVLTIEGAGRPAEK